MTEHQPPLPDFPTPEPPSPHDPQYRTIRAFTADARFLRKLAAELDCTISAALSHVIEVASNAITNVPEPVRPPAEIKLLHPIEDYDLQEADAAFREELTQQEWEREVESWTTANSWDEPSSNESA